MWRRRKVFTCSICGKESPSRYIQVFFGVPDEISEIQTAPHGWTGDETKNGQCFCDTCSRAIAKVRNEHKEVSE